jgi:hypothetical protein
MRQWPRFSLLLCWGSVTPLVEKTEERKPFLCAWPLVEDEHRFPLITNGNPARLEVSRTLRCYRTTSREVFMKKRVKRAKSKSSSKRGRTKPKSKRTTSAILPKAKQVAKKAALAAGAAAIGTALSELQPEQKRAGRDASNESESKPRNPTKD